MQPVSVPEPSSSPKTPAPRVPALDAARAFGVVAMVVGHTLDALLATSLRDEPLAVAYWKARGLTAPLFLMASGWAVTVALARRRGSGPGVPLGRLPRVLLLLAVGYALRWPGWGTEQLLAGDREVWAHLLAFDALHTIAISVLAIATVLGLPLSLRERVGALAALCLVALSLGMAAPAPLPVDPGALPPPPVAMALAQAAGGSSPFPLFPWTAYAFAGAIVGLLVQRGERRRLLWLAIVGGAMVLATFHQDVGVLPAGHPVLFTFRVGLVLVAFAALSAVPARLAKLTAPLGRASLGVYVLHVPVVYGWSTHEGLAQRIGPSLAPGPAVLASAAVLAASFVLAHALAAGLGALRSTVRSGSGAREAVPLPAALRGERRAE